MIYKNPGCFPNGEPGNKKKLILVIRSIRVIRLFIRRVVTLSGYDEQRPIWLRLSSKIDTVIWFVFDSRGVNL